MEFPSMADFYPTNKKCKDCTNKKECMRKKETKQGEYCLHYNTISKDIYDWCRRIK